METNKLLGNYEDKNTKEEMSPEELYLDEKERDPEVAKIQKIIEEHMNKHTKKGKQK